MISTLDKTSWPPDVVNKPNLYCFHKSFPPLQAFQVPATRWFHENLGPGYRGRQDLISSAIPREIFLEE